MNHRFRHEIKKQKYKADITAYKDLPYTRYTAKGYVDYLYNREKFMLQGQIDSIYYPKSIGKTILNAWFKGSDASVVGRRITDPDGKERIILETFSYCRTKRRRR